MFDFYGVWRLRNFRINGHVRTIVFFQSGASLNTLFLKGLTQDKPFKRFNFEISVIQGETVPLNIVDHINIT